MYDIRSSNINLMNRRVHYTHSDFECPWNGDSEVECVVISRRSRGLIADSDRSATYRTVHARVPGSRKNNVDRYVIITIVITRERA